MILHGNENLTEAQNVDIFTAVQTFMGHHQNTRTFLLFIRN